MHKFAVELKEDCFGHVYNPFTPFVLTLMGRQMMRGK